MKVTSEQFLVSPPGTLLASSSSSSSSSFSSSRVLTDRRELGLLQSRLLCLAQFGPVWPSLKEETQHGAAARSRKVSEMYLQTDASHISLCLCPSRLYSFELFL